MLFCLYYRLFPIKYLFFIVVIAIQSQSKLTAYNNTTSNINQTHLMFRFKAAFINFHEAHHSQAYVSMAITNSKLVNGQKYYKIKWKNSAQNVVYSSWENKFITSFIMKQRHILSSAQDIDVDQEAMISKKFSILVIFGGEYYAVDTFTTEDNYKCYEKSIKSNALDLIKEAAADGSITMKRVRFKPSSPSSQAVSDLLLEIHKIMLREGDLPFQVLNEQNGQFDKINKIDKQFDEMRDQAHNERQNQFNYQVEEGVMIKEKNDEKKRWRDKSHQDQSINIPKGMIDSPSQQLPPIIEPEIKIEQTQKLINLSLSFPNQNNIEPLQQTLKSKIKIEQKEKAIADAFANVQNKNKMSYGLLDRLDLPKDIKEKLYFEPNIKILKHKVDKQKNWQIQVRNGSMDIFWLPEAILQELGYSFEVKQYRELIELYNEAESLCPQE